MTNNNDQLTAIIEMPSGTYYKYEYDAKIGRLVLDRPLTIPVPYSYGFIENTLSMDGDPLDVFICTYEPLAPMSQVKIGIIGIFVCEDNGVEDNKVVASVIGDRWHSPRISKIEGYLTRYKKGFVVKDFVTDHGAIQQLINAAQVNRQL